MLERDDAHLEHVAGLRLVDIDRPGQHVRAAAARAVDLGADVERVLQDLFARDAGLPKNSTGSSGRLMPPWETVSIRTVWPDLMRSTGGMSAAK